MTAINSTWKTEDSQTSEYFITSIPNNHSDFSHQCDKLFSDYTSAASTLGLSAHPPLTVTLYLSDAANQESQLRAHPGFQSLERQGAAISILQQPPVRSKIAMQAYHVCRPTPVPALSAAPARCKDGAACISVDTEGYGFRYFKNLRAAGNGDAGSQTTALMGVAGQGCLDFQVSLPEIVRTWLFIHDIDSSYKAVSDARNALFERHGISAATGFPASTGIEGRTGDHRDLLMMDAHAIKGLKPGQSRAMTAPGYMNPTVEYGVTFERGREVVFGDRRHLYISGTASIDDSGRILHEGDAARQTARAVENIRALLANSGARLEDMRQLLVYLRDPHDADAVESVLAETPLHPLPRIMVRAPVCRPGWLVELEGIAIDGKGDPAYHPF